MTTHISERIEELTRTRVPFVRATVVRAQEPSSARAGDRAIVLADGSIEGFVGGQCAAGAARTAGLGAPGTGVGPRRRGAPAGRPGARRGPPAPGAAGRRAVVPAGARRDDRGEPLPVRRSAGDLPRSAAV